MTKLTRRILFYGFFLLFIIVVPAVILWSLGLRFDFKKRKIVTVGAIYLKTSQRDFQLLLNDKIEHKTSFFSNSILISGLFPKNWNVKVEKNGFEAWSKTLRVEPKLVTEATSIFLIPKNIKSELVLENQKNLSAIISAEIKIKKNEYAIDETGIVWKIEGLDSKKTAINALPIAKESIKNAEILETSGSIFILTKEELLLEKKREEQNFKEINRDVKKIIPSSKNEKFLILKEKEIWVLWPEETLAQPPRKKDEKELIGRYSEKIDDAVWYAKTDEHVIFSVNGKIKIAELDGRDNRNTYDIADKPAKKLFYDLRSKKLYFLNEQNIFAIEI
ncbi:MAG: hypothetical protein HYV52_03080 [Parcubacteria group bacterium]|nr:hypothetical protein [Parcubacteria group bacterium]